ncbi:MAG TPA: acetate--CoA ligase family protein [Candidatus Dormibacteraeota bacterium]|nr:acetate--CoA ligase family protein [Candidatus Dormibacteraeota bacterium]
MSWFLDPGSVALVGATERSLWSAILVTNFRTLGYGGQVHLVHPRNAEAFGQRCFPSLEAVPEAVDHAYVMTGTAAAFDVIEDCGRAGVRNVTMLTSGFRETGPEGAALEARLVARCEELGIRLQGPNCLGFVNYHRRVPAYGLILSPPLEPGGIALLSQSGAMLLQFHRLSQARGIGLAYTVSIGNEAMLDASAFFEELVERPEVRVLGALLEGIRRPERFLALADRALAAGKPLVIYKIGGGEVTSRSVAAHTGSLAGADAVVDAAFRQHGVVRVRSLEELVETCAALARGWPAGSRTAVITTSGGSCGMIADLAYGTRVEMPDFALETKRRLAELLPAFGTPQNPLDTTGVIVDQPELLAGCIDAVAGQGQGGYDALLINSDAPRDPGPNPAVTERRLALLAEAMRATPVYTTLASSSSLDPSPYSREVMGRHGLHFAGGLEMGVRTLHHAIGYGQARARMRPVPGRRSIVPPLVEGWAGVVPELEAKRLLAEYDIRAPAERLALDADEAAAVAAEIGFPVVLKVQSPDIAHRSDVGGVRLGLRSAAEVRDAWDAVLAAVRSHRPDARVDGLLVAEQVEPVVELIAGVKRDALFGPVVVAGAGGIFVEVLADVALRLPPLDEAEAAAMLDELRVAPLLHGARGRPVADAAAAAGVLARLGELALDLGPRLLELDVNPLLVLPDGQGALAADALVVLTDPPSPSEGEGRGGGDNSKEDRH